MAYRTSRGDIEASHVRFMPANEAGSVHKSELNADPAIERIGPPAPQRDGEADEAPEQRVLVPAVEPRKSGLPIEHRDDEHFHRGGRGEEAREQADDERDTADELDDQRRPDPRQRRIEPLLHEGADIGRRPARDLAPAVHQEIPAHRDAHDRPGERDGEIVKRLEAEKQQLGFVLDVLRHVLSSLMDLLALYVFRMGTACSVPRAAQRTVFTKIDLVSRAQRSTKWCAADPGPFQSLAVPDQRRTVPRWRTPRCAASGTQD